MPAPSNRIPVRPARGSRTVLTDSLDSIQEGEIVYARDEDSLFIKENGQLVNVAIGTGVDAQKVSAEITWTIATSAAEDAYLFSGQGFASQVENPTIYVIRGQKYAFDHQLGTDPFQITTPDGTPYVIGQTNTPADGSILRWEVSMQAPKILRYVSTEDSNKSGEIIAISDSFSLGLEDLTNVDNAVPADGQVMIYSSSQGAWQAADLTTGGVTSLNGLTDVDTSSALESDVLKFNGTYWEALPEATDVGTAGRKVTMSIDSTRRGQMLGTEFILDSTADWEGLGFTVLSTNNNETDSWFYFTFSTFQGKRWVPLGRNDSIPYNSDGDVDPTFGFDGSGRLVSWTNTPFDVSPIASTKNLSAPQNCAFCFTAFLESSNCTVYRAGYKEGLEYEGGTWSILRVEYAKFDTLLAVEYWLGVNGDVKMLYGRPDGNFNLNVDTNSNGFTFGGRTDDPTLGNANYNLPGLTQDAGYGIELWYNGSGYNIDDLSNVSHSGDSPPTDNFPLVWSSGSWGPGSIIREGSQSSTSGGEVGIFAVDSVYLYVCVGKNNWKRIALEDFI